MRLFAEDNVKSLQFFKCIPYSPKSKIEATLSENVDNPKSKIGDSLGKF